VPSVHHVEHDELGRQRGRHADLDVHLPAVDPVGRVRLLVALHVEGLALLRAGECPLAPLRLEEERHQPGHRLP
jgi:hypothetical protein